MSNQDSDIQTRAAVIANWVRKQTKPDDLAQVIQKFAPVETFVDEPARYAKERLGLLWTEDQRIVAKSVVVNKRTVVASAHGVGKTHASAGIAQWFYDTYNPSIVLTTAPSWQSVRDLLWAEISDQRHRAGISSGSFTGYDEGIPLVLRDSEFHYAKGHNARTGEGFQGRHGVHVLIILDEAAGVPEHIWKAAESMLQSEHCRILAIGNPTTQSGPYYDALHSRLWHSIHISSLDHPNIKAELTGQEPPYPAAVRLSWVQEMLERHCEPVSLELKDESCFEFPEGSGAWYLPNDEFRIRCLGLLALKSATSVWNSEWIDKARDRKSGAAGLLTEGICMVGVDVARYGDDKSVIMSRRGEKLTACLSAQGLSTVEVTGHTVRAVQDLVERFELEDASQIIIMVDDDGVGGGVTDQLRALGYFVIGINGGSTPLWPLRYPNRRSELWFMGAELGRKGLIDLSEMEEWQYQSLRADLLTPQYTLDRKGRRLVEFKEKMRKRVGRSPDFGDSFNLCFADPYVFNYVGEFKGEVEVGYVGGDF